MCSTLFGLTLTGRSVEQQQQQQQRQVQSRVCSAGSKRYLSMRAQWSLSCVDVFVADAGAVSVTLPCRGRGPAVPHRVVCWVLTAF